VSFVHATTADPRIRVVVGIGIGQIVGAIARREPLVPNSLVIGGDARELPDLKHVLHGEVTGQGLARGAFIAIAANVT